MWQSLNGKKEIVDVFPGVCLTIPLGTHFQFRSFDYEPLSAVGIIMPYGPVIAELVRMVLPLPFAMARSFFSEEQLFKLPCPMLASLG